MAPFPEFMEDAITVSWQHFGMKVKTKVKGKHSKNNTKIKKNSPKKKRKHYINEFWQEIANYNSEE